MSTADISLTRIVQTYCTDCYRRFRASTQPGQLSRRLSWSPKKLLRQQGESSSDPDLPERPKRDSHTSGRHSGCLSSKSSIPSIVVTEPPEPGCNVPSAPILDPSFLHPTVPSKRSREADGQQCNCLWCVCHRPPPHPRQSQTRAKKRDSGNIRASILGMLKMTKASKKTSPERFVYARPDNAAPRAEGSESGTRGSRPAMPSGPPSTTTTTTPTPDLDALNWIPTPCTSRAEIFITDALFKGSLSTDATQPPSPLPQPQDRANLLTAMTPGDMLICKYRGCEDKKIGLRRMVAVLAAGATCVTLTEKKRSKLMAASEELARFCEEREMLHRECDCLFRAREG